MVWYRPSVTRQGSVVSLPGPLPIQLFPQLADGKLQMLFIKCFHVESLWCYMNRMLFEVMYNWSHMEPFI